MVRQILCPVDLSELSGRALLKAAAMARSSGARLAVLHACQFDVPPYFTHGQVARMGEESREALRQADAELRDFVADTLGPEGPAWDAWVVEAPPVEAILRAAQETQADLIVMGTHGRGGFIGLMLGSVAEGVKKKSPVPVLTVSGSDSQEVPHAV